MSRFLKNIEIFIYLAPNITYVILPYKQSFIITCIMYQYWYILVSHRHQLWLTKVKGHSLEEYPGGGRGSHS